MSENQTQSAADLNEQADRSRQARTAAAVVAAAPPAKPAKASRPPAKPKAAAKTAPPAKPVRTRRALTPRERAAKPVTATIRDYVEWLNATVFDGKMTAAQQKAAGISITLYGAYQISPERRAARGA